MTRGVTGSGTSSPSDSATVSEPQQSPSQARDSGKNAGQGRSSGHATAPGQPPSSPAVTAAPAQAPQPQGMLAFLLAPDPEELQQGQPQQQQPQQLEGDPRLPAAPLAARTGAHAHGPVPPASETALGRAVGAGEREVEEGAEPAAAGGQNGEPGSPVSLGDLPVEALDFDPAAPSPGGSLINELEAFLRGSQPMHMEVAQQDMANMQAAMTLPQHLPQAGLQGVQPLLAALQGGPQHMATAAAAAAVGHAQHGAPLPCGITTRELAISQLELLQDAGLASDDEAADLPGMVNALQGKPVVLGGRAPLGDPAGMQRLLAGSGPLDTLLADLCGMTLDGEGLTVQQLYQHYRDLQGECEQLASGATLEHIRLFGGADEEAAFRELESLLSSSTMFEWAEVAAGERRWRLASDLHAHQTYVAVPHKPTSLLDTPVERRLRSLRRQRHNVPAHAPPAPMLNSHQHAVHAHARVVAAAVHQGSARREPPQLPQRETLQMQQREIPQMQQRAPVEEGPASARDGGGQLPEEEDSLPKDFDVDDMAVLRIVGLAEPTISAEAPHQEQAPHSQAGASHHNHHRHHHHQQQQQGTGREEGQILGVEQGRRPYPEVLWDPDDTDDIDISDSSPRPPSHRHSGKAMLKNYDRLNDSPAVRMFKCGLRKSGAGASQSGQGGRAGTSGDEGHWGGGPGGYARVNGHSIYTESRGPTRESESVQQGTPKQGATPNPP